MNNCAKLLGDVSQTMPSATYIKFQELLVNVSRMVQSCVAESLCQKCWPLHARTTYDFVTQCHCSMVSSHNHIAQHLFPAWARAIPFLSSATILNGSHGRDYKLAQFCAEVICRPELENGIAWRIHNTPSVLCPCYKRWHFKEVWCYPSCVHYTLGDLRPRSLPCCPDVFECVLLRTWDSAPLRARQCSWHSDAKGWLGDGRTNQDVFVAACPLQSRQVRVK